MSMTNSGTVTPDLIELTIDQAQSAFADGVLTAEALTRAALDRIEALNPILNAIVFSNPKALEVARAIDDRRARGEILGPLAGIPIVVKDTMDMVDFPTTGGWSKLHPITGGVALTPSRDSMVVARMQAAGAVILGKTNVPILSHTGSHANDSWAGPTYNAAGRDFVPGGSSAGTASAVASSMAVVGLGEETGGSIQNPAAAQALVGVKPSFGLVPTSGVMPLSGLRDVVGPIARCVRDAALTLDVLAGYSPDDPRTAASIGHTPAGGYASGLSADGLRGKRIGTYGPGWRDQDLSDETDDLYHRALAELELAGGTLVSDPFHGTSFAALRVPTPPMADYDGRGLESLPYDLQRYLQGMTPGGGPRSFEALLAIDSNEEVFGRGVLGFLSNLPEYTACSANPGVPPAQEAFVAARGAYVALFNAVLDQLGLDALAFPHARTELPRLHSGSPIRETTVCEVNIAGLPVVTVPAGYYASGAPFSLVFVGRMWDEARLLSLAYAYEVGTSHRKVPPIGQNR